MRKKTTVLDSKSKELVENINQRPIAIQKLNSFDTWKALANVQRRMRFDSEVSNNLRTKKYIRSFEALLKNAAAVIDATLEATDQAYKSVLNDTEIPWDDLKLGEFYELFKCAHKAKLLFLDIVELLIANAPEKNGALLSLSFQLGSTVQAFQSIANAPAAAAKRYLLRKSSDGGTKSTKFTPADRELILRLTIEGYHEDKPFKRLDPEVKRKFQLLSGGKTVSIRTIQEIRKGKFPS